MIAVDTNVLVYAHREETEPHERARRRLAGLATGDAQWGLPVLCLSEFVRVVTHPSVFHPPTPLDDALAAVDELLQSPTVVVLRPGEGWWPLFRERALEGATTGNLVFDAAIAALCEERGARTLLTEDRDFARFSTPATERL